MTKILPATCENHVVKYGAAVVEADVLTQGKAASTGILLLDEERVKYLTANTTDIVAVIEKISTVLSSISSALSTLQGGGWSGPPPVIAGDLADIADIQSDLDTLKANLK